MPSTTLEKEAIKYQLRGATCSITLFSNGCKYYNWWTYTHKI